MYIAKSKTKKRVRVIVVEGTIINIINNNGISSFFEGHINMRIKRTNNKGFSMVELMIVVGIIGLLAMIAVPNFVRFRNNALLATAVGSCEAIRTAMGAYASSSDGNLYPVGKFEDGLAGWESFRSFMLPLGTPLKANIKEQGFQNFTYQTIAVHGQDGSDYFFIFQSASTPPDQTGSLIEVRPSGINRWTGSL